jgi:hypothetical protein
MIKSKGKIKRKEENCYGSHRIREFTTPKTSKCIWGRQFKGS